MTWQLGWSQRQLEGYQRQLGGDRNDSSKRARDREREREIEKTVVVVLLVVVVRLR